ncbi:hypothetical protein D7S86_00790 [Pararobbsia silviterrae]|uniref:Uncharacterized protein n=1 Tax=Pararobbsia silviterrae TaxID=1792498 RepID=A0A494YDW1_9BURK|nr:hypothetical protein D7S86_00790 [Pararobbsia silviterrae]
MRPTRQRHRPELAGAMPRSARWAIRRQTRPTRERHRPKLDGAMPGSARQMRPMGSIAES